MQADELHQAIKGAKKGTEDYIKQLHYFPTFCFWSNRQQAIISIFF
jgi:hypothetical protein